MSDARDRIDFPELLVKADSWDEVNTILKDELNIERKFNASDKEITGYFIVRLIQDNKGITQHFYDSIQKSKKVNILIDGKEDQKRREEVMRKSGRIEQRLRKLLLHISDSVENYIDLFKKPLVKKRAEGGIVQVDGLNPLVSHLEFGNMIDILSTDLSLKGKETNIYDFAKLIQNCSDFEELKINLADKLKERRVWDVIANTLLETPSNWNDIKKDLNTLKEYRNAAAHQRTITPDGLQEVNAIIGRLSEKLKVKSDAKLSLEESKEIEDVFNSIYEAVRPSRTIIETLNDIQKNYAPSPSLAQVAQEALNYNIGQMRAALSTPSIAQILQNLPVGPETDQSSEIKK